MSEPLHRLFLKSSADALWQHTARIETCIGQLTTEQIWARGGEHENAIGNLILHLCGNVRQWIVSGAGAQPDHRNRPGEFAARSGMDAAALAGRLRETIEAAAAVLSTLSAERLAERLTIQDYDVTVLEAIYHSVEHFSGHAGQIIFITKMLTGSDLGFYRHLNAPQGEKTP